MDINPLLDAREMGLRNYESVCQREGYQESNKSTASKLPRIKK